MSSVQLAQGRQEGRGLSNTREHTSHMQLQRDAWMGTQRKSITQSQTQMNTLRLRPGMEGDEARATHLDPYTQQHTCSLITGSSGRLEKLPSPPLPQMGKKHFRNNASFCQKLLRSYKSTLFLKGKGCRQEETSGTCLLT